MIISEFGDLVDLVGKFGVNLDPDEKEAVRLGQQILSRHLGATGAAAGGSAAAGPSPARRIVPWLKRYQYIQENPWVPYAAVAGIVTVLMGTGYVLGRKA